MDKKCWKNIFKYIQKENQTEIKKIFDYGYNINAVHDNENEGITPLMFSTELQNLNIFKLLLNNGAEISLTSTERNNNILNWAVKWGYQNNLEKIIKIMQEKEKFDINFKNKSGNTALMCASFYGNTNAANIIMKYNPDLNLTNEDGMTALNMAFMDKINDREEIRNLMSKIYTQRIFAKMKLK